MGKTVGYIFYSNSLDPLESSMLDSIILVNSAKDYNWVLYFPDDTTVKYIKKPEIKWLNPYGKTIIKSKHIDNGKLYIFEYMSSEYAELYSVEIKKGLGHGRYMEYKYIDDVIELSEYGYLSKGRLNGVQVYLEQKSKCPGISYWKNGKFLCSYSYSDNGNKKRELNRGLLMGLYFFLKL